MPLFRTTFDVKGKCDGLAIVLFLLIGWMTTGRVSGEPAVQGQTVDSRTFIELKRGITLAKLESTFQNKPTHEFTVLRNGETIRCVRYDLITPATYQSYYFVFTNDSLTLICLPPPLEYGTRVENDNRVGFVIVQPEKIVETVIHSEDLNGEALAKSVAQVMSLKRTNKWDMKMIPVVIIFAPLAIAAAPYTLVENNQWNRKFNAQREKFDPFKVRLGMTVEEVEAMFGTPFTIGKSSDNLDVRYYGSPRFGEYKEPWVSVVFDQGKAVRVFSDRFFDDEVIRGVLRQKSAKH